MVTEQHLKRLRNMLEWRERQLVDMEESVRRFHITKEVEALQAALSVLVAEEA